MRQPSWFAFSQGVVSLCYLLKAIPVCGLWSLLLSVLQSEEESLSWLLVCLPTKDTWSCLANPIASTEFFDLNVIVIMHLYGWLCPSFFEGTQCQLQNLCKTCSSLATLPRSLVSAFLIAHSLSICLSIAAHHGNCNGWCCSSAGRWQAHSSGKSWNLGRLLQHRR